MQLATMHWIRAIFWFRLHGMIQVALRQYTTSRMMPDCLTHTMNKSDHTSLPVDPDLSTDPCDEKVTERANTQHENANSSCLRDGSTEVDNAYSVMAYVNLNDNTSAQWYIGLAVIFAIILERQLNLADLLLSPHAATSMTLCDQVVEAWNAVQTLLFETFPNLRQQKQSNRQKSRRLIRSMLVTSEIIDPHILQEHLSTSISNRLELADVTRERYEAAITTSYKRREVIYWPLI